MKVLVANIDKEVFKKFISKCKLESQIAVLDTQLAEEDKKTYSKFEPFYIEDNLKSLPSNLFNYHTRDFNFDDFCDCWRFLLKLQKKKDFGCIMSDTEYIYRKGIELNLQIEFKKASTDLGFTSDANYSVITGNSELGKMILYQEDGFIEFVFSLEYEKPNLFSKKSIKNYTHWHPYDLNMALEDMIAFMNNDKNYFRIKGLYL